jgi:hypothetical protein
MNAPVCLYTFDMDMSYTRVLHKRRVPRTSQMTSRLLRHTALAMLAHNVLCNSYNTAAAMRAHNMLRNSYYVTVITHGRCYARA